MCLQNLYIHTQLIDDHTKAASQQNQERDYVYLKICPDYVKWQNMTTRALLFNTPLPKIAHCNSLRSTSIAHSTSLLSRQFKLNFVIHVTHSAKYFVICFLNKINIGD